MPVLEAIAPFESPLKQIDAELEWLALRLKVVFERSKQARSVGPPAEYRGLYVTDEEVDRILAPENEGAAADQLVAQAAALRADLDLRALSGNPESPLDLVAREFCLNPSERQLLIIALAPYLDPAYEKIFAYANDDITKRWPTVGLALEVLDGDRAGRLALRPIFYEDGRLARHALLTSSEPGSGFLPSRPLTLDPHVAEVLLGYRGTDPRLRNLAHLVELPAREPANGALLASVLLGRGQARVYAGGRWRTEKEEAIAWACSRNGVGLLALSMPLLARASEPQQLLSLALRDAQLLHCALLLEDFGGQDCDSDVLAFASELARALIDHPLPVFLSDRSPSPAQLPLDLHLHLEFKTPNFDARQQVWLSKAGLDPDCAFHLAATYRLGARETQAAIEMAKTMASLDEREAITLADLKAAARTQSQPRLTPLAQKITPHYSWDDIVLPEDQKAQLREIADQVLYQHVVYEEWGLVHQSSLGRGVGALFAGQSGTGKTMAAEIVGNELGLDVYKIDLSGLVSKYIGETEKNLARVFEEASDTNAILFFDEADAVFGKRSEVRDSHDRYANIEVSYLLQKMEEYDGIVVLASNLRSNLDEAFLRRMRAIVEFPFPEADDRLRIWQRMFASTAPLAPDVDLAFLARQFRIAGGNIRNIVLLAAFLAASEEQAIGMTHLIRATKREYQKLGRLVTEGDFGRWYEELRA